MNDLRDTPEIRSVLSANYPGLNIDQVARSGQRLVYFGRFDDFNRVHPDEDVEVCRWSEWGEVVLKVSDGSSINDMARMHAEVSALAEIESSSYPVIYHFELLSYDPEDESPLDEKLFVTVEQRIPGVELAKCMHNYAREADAIRLCIQLIEALCDLWFHTRKYVHRDIKPQNLLIKEDGHLVVIDLGIIRQTGQKGITRTMLPIGPCTPGYGSPEQISNDKDNISLKSDLFSIGVIIYEVLFGANPFVANTNGLEEVVHKTVYEDPPTLYSLGLASKEFSDVVSGLIEKEPYKRPRSVRKLIEKLRAIQGEAK